MSPYEPRIVTNQEWKDAMDRIDSLERTRDQQSGAFRLVTILLGVSTGSLIWLVVQVLANGGR